MPDPERKSVSASQIAALWNASPWATRWMLWQQFANGVVMEEPESSRMKWGKLIEPLVIGEVMQQWQLEVTHNLGNTYYRRGLVGATRDATIIAPGKGEGAVEVKCVFDYPTWMNDWQGGRTVPRHVELQLQTQMYVGDGKRPFQWGLIAVWVCAGAELHYYEREPIIKLWTQIELESKRFFASVEGGEEPDPYGAEVELPWLTSLYQTAEGETLDLSDKYEHVKTAEDLRTYEIFKDQRASSERVTKEYRAKFLALAKSAREVILPCGFRYRVQKSGGGKTVVPFIPEVPTAPPPPPEPIIQAG